MLSDCDDCRCVSSLRLMREETEGRPLLVPLGLGVYVHVLLNSDLFLSPPVTL